MIINEEAKLKDYRAQISNVGMDGVETKEH